MTYCIKRLTAFAIDWILLFLIAVPLSLLGPDFNKEYLLYPSIRMFSAYGVILSAAAFLIIPLVKDLLFKNASLGKKIFGLKIVKNGTNEPASPFQIIIRSLLFYFVIPNLIAFFITKRSIGDLLAKTNVI